MKPYWKQDNNIIYQGHVPEVLASMESESVQMCVTSPPYWGLRDYGLEPQIWDSDENCRHEWGETGPEHHPGQVPDNKAVHDENAKGQTAGSGQFCQLCNAWRGSLGLEPTPELFIDHIVQVFREVWRVLRKDGTVWLNLGDSYASGKGSCFNPGGGENSLEGHAKLKEEGAYKLNRPNISDLERMGLKPKDLIGIPWRVALALQADGWYLRSAMPWVKRSAMPESVNDRPSSALEYMFLLTKSAKYYFDMEAIKLKTGNNTHSKGNKLNPPIESAGIGHVDWHKKTPDILSSRNFRNTDLFYQSIAPPCGMIFCGDELIGLDVNPQAMKESHFATFPEKLIEPCILAGTSEKGCCVECGAPWERVVEKQVPELRDVKSHYPGEHTIATRKYKHNDDVVESKTLGWKPGCKCYGTCPFPEYPKQDKDELDDIYEKRIEPIRAERLRLLELWKPLPVVPCVVCDIFLGSGTSLVVSNKHGRNFTGIELSESYLKDIAIPRIEKATKQRRLFK